MQKILLFGLCLLALSGYSQTVGVLQYATGFSSAVAIEHPANDSRMFVVQQGGLIRIVNSNGTVNATPFLNLGTTGANLISSGGERGLLGLAFHPNYATNGLFYVNYTRINDGHTVIARYSVSSTDPNVANTTGTVLMVINQPSSNHNGGSLRFGPDGYLYIGMGDGGGAGDTSGYAQNLSLTHTPVVSQPSRIYLGKMLRIDVDTTAPGLNYGFPATNPYVSEAGKQEIWAIGLRNPWKFSFNRTNGDLWIADVGQGSLEEIDKVASPLPNTGINFGWRCYEGTANYDLSGTCPAESATIGPIAEYSSATGSRCSVTGGYFYTGTQYPNFANKYFFADYCTGEIGTIDNTGTITWGYDAPSSITTFGEDMNGELYTIYGNVLYKIVDTLGADEFSKNGFSLYPNPAKETVFVKSTTDIMAAKIELFDMSGKLLLSKNVDTMPEHSIPVSGLAKGMYVVSVETAEGKRFNTKLAVE